jgi:hypothetical protein
VTGTVDVRADKESQLTLAPGNDDEIIIGKESQVLVTGGTYRIRRLDMDKETVVTFLAPTELFISRNFPTLKNVTHCIRRQIGNFSALLLGTSQAHG